MCFASLDRRLGRALGRVGELRSRLSEPRACAEKDTENQDMNSHNASQARRLCPEFLISAQENALCSENGTSQFGTENGKGVQRPFVTAAPRCMRSNSSDVTFS